MTRILRTTSRVVPVDPSGRVLLLQDEDPAVPGILRWGSIGGAVDAGETLTDAAVRELHEETSISISADRLTAPFLESTGDFSFDGVAYRSHNTWFALALDADTPVSFEHLVEDEVGSVHAAGWWTPDALDDDGTAVEPDLPGILREAVRAVLGSGA